ncbi:MAG: hypothetical protein LBU65_00575 [Planctomycetaceae bacterium]|jgi:hypothetical protein|nr:hypothetical protein [Planctomycetaceae bacterium]
MNFFHFIYLTHFSKPADERIIYRAIRSKPPRLMVECNIQRGVRMMRMLDLVKRTVTSQNSFEYVCTDPFEGRTEIDGPGLSLRKTHKLISQLNLRHRCIPAPVEVGIMHLSRSVRNVDFLVAATPNLDWLASKGALLASTLTTDATVFLKAINGTFQHLTTEQFQQMVNTAVTNAKTTRRAA